MIRPLSLNDDLEKVAYLVYHTDESLFGSVFGPYDTVKPLLIELIKASDNSFSHRFIRVYVDSEMRIQGLSISFSKEEKPNDSDFNKIIKGMRALRVGMVSLFLRNLLNPNIKDTYYLQNLSVDSQARNKGIGSKLLQDFYKEAKFKNKTMCSLDVSLSNKKALRLYLKEGFKLIRKRRFLGIYPLTYWCEKTISY